MALGMLPSEVEQLGIGDYDLLLRYWSVEPWGAWRDNVHAAIIAREIRRPFYKDQKANTLEDLMLKIPDAAPPAAADRSNVFDLFKMIAVRRKRDGSR